MRVIVYSDGSGTTGGPGGIGYVAHGVDTGYRREGKLPLRDATNQKAEILAAAFALHELPDGCDVMLYSDSKYVVRGMNEWMSGWISRGWRTSSNKEVANIKHWMRLLTAVERHVSVKFDWTPGHAGIEGNERADRLADAARREAMEMYA